MDIKRHCLPRRGQRRLRTCSCFDGAQRVRVWSVEGFLIRCCHRSETRVAIPMKAVVIDSSAEKNLTQRLAHRAPESAAGPGASGPASPDPFPCVSASIR